jgi:hypothetical protein
VKQLVAVGVGSTQTRVPDGFSLQQNFPNPFNPESVIIYSIGSNLHVSLRIYDVLGREIASLVDQYQTAGTYRVPFSIFSQQVPSGIYFYTLTAGTFVSTKRMVVLK